MLELLRLELKIADHRLVVKLLSLISVCITTKQQIAAKDCYRSSCTVKPCLTATSVIRSPRYYGHSFWPPCKTATQSLQKRPRLYNHALIRPNLLGPLMTVLTGLHHI